MIEGSANLGTLPYLLLDILSGGWDVLLVLTGSASDDWRSPFVHFFLNLLALDQ